MDYSAVDLAKRIKKSIEKFELDLNGRCVLTEAATGLYSLTSVMAAVSGADVIAIAKNTEYGSIEDIKNTIHSLLQSFPECEGRIKIIESKFEINARLDVVTNSGFVRPIDNHILRHMDDMSVISLMYEPWEFRESDVDLMGAKSIGVKIYGTNEHDDRLRTMEYIGFIVLNQLLMKKITPFSDKKIAVLGSGLFVQPILELLIHNNYHAVGISVFDVPVDVDDFDIFVLAEMTRRDLLVGRGAVIDRERLEKKHLIIHLCGAVDVAAAAEDREFECIPVQPAPFGYMSFRTDFIDPQALIDLQAGGLAVAMGMLKANELGLTGCAYKSYMESNYPALSFTQEKYR